MMHRTNLMLEHFITCNRFVLKSVFWYELILICLIGKSKGLFINKDRHTKYSSSIRHFNLLTNVTLHTCMMWVVYF